MVSIKEFYRKLEKYKRPVELGLLVIILLSACDSVKTDAQNTLKDVGKKTGEFFTGVVDNNKAAGEKEYYDENGNLIVQEESGSSSGDSSGDGDGRKSSELSVDAICQGSPLIGIDAIQVENSNEWMLRPREKNREPVRKDGSPVECCGSSENEGLCLIGGVLHNLTPDGKIVPVDANQNPKPTQSELGELTLSDLIRSSFGEKCDQEKIQRAEFKDGEFLYPDTYPFFVGRPNSLSGTPQGFKINPDGLDGWNGPEEITNSRCYTAGEKGNFCSVIDASSGKVVGILCGPNGKQEYVPIGPEGLGIFYTPNNVAVGFNGQNTNSVRIRQGDGN